jgi:hypothetical protein
MEEPEDGWSATSFFMMSASMMGSLPNLLGVIANDCSSLLGTWQICDMEGMSEGCSASSLLSSVAALSAGDFLATSKLAQGVDL